MVAIAAIAAEIYLIVKAYQSWQQASQQAAQAYSQYQSNSSADLQMIANKYGTSSAQYQQELAIVNNVNQQASADQYKAPQVLAVASSRCAGTGTERLTGVDEAPAGTATGGGQGADKRLPGGAARQRGRDPAGQRPGRRGQSAASDYAATGRAVVSRSST